MLASIIAMLFEFRTLKKQHNYRVIVFSASMLIIGLLLATLQYFRVKMPSPLLAINMIFKPISQLVTKLLTE
jgi:uncharacterized membrane protein HdeD (DUF308 family)